MNKPWPVCHRFNQPEVGGSDSEQSFHTGIAVLCAICCVFCIVESMVGCINRNGYPENNPFQRASRPLHFFMLLPANALILYVSSVRSDETVERSQG